MVNIMVNNFHNFPTIVYRKRKRKRGFGAGRRIKRRRRGGRRRFRRTSRRSARSKWKSGRKRRTYAGVSLFRSGALPNTTRTVLDYSQFVTVTAAQQVTGKYTFRANSIFDPDLTGVGHQPKFRDQMAVYYNRYRVLACSISVGDVFISNTANTPVMAIGVVPSLRSDVTPNYMGNIARMYEDGVKHKKFVERDIGQRSLLTKVGGYVKMKNILQKIDFDIDHLNSASPPDDTSVDWDIIFASTTNVTPTSDLSMIVKLKYYVEFTDPIIVGQS